MPRTCCCVPRCCLRGGHEFPSDTQRKDKWIKAIKRIDETTLKNWIPSGTAVVCKAHFTTNDYVQETIQGRKPLKMVLLSTAIPSQFEWTRPHTDSQIGRQHRSKERESRKRKLDFETKYELETELTYLDYGEETVICNTDEHPQLEVDTGDTATTNSSTQTCTDQPKFDVAEFREHDKAIHFFTGLECYTKFIFVLNSLGPAAFCLNYVYHNVVNVSVPNQFFMMLVKLRRYQTYFEMSLKFGISEACVKNIVFTWILFVAKQWREVNIWPSQNLVKYFSPSDFKSKFPTTRVVIDGTECPVKKPKPPRAQQSTFSTYKNRNTVKILIGASPGGLISYISPAYGGSTSDRQIVERSNLLSCVDPGDSIMADKGFNVQDLFAPRNVAINIPTFFRKKNRMSGNIVMKDRKISSKRVHIERIIGLGKTYKILCNPMTSTETKLSSDIVFICYMLCNFRTCIVSSNA